MKNFTESKIFDFVSVTDFKIPTYITPDKYLTPCWKQIIVRIQMQPPENPFFQFFEIIDADLTCLSCNCDFSVATDKTSAKLFFPLKPLRCYTNCNNF